ncbi:MAG: OmpH family outer membrane protein [Candidatus Wallbacteria bacterium]|nr:OmpH family outer membrane protein [Candidatus Wallbacteria bacterium]
MKKSLLLTTMVLIFVSRSFAEDVKIGFVDYEKVFTSFYKTEMVNEDLKKKTDDWQVKLDGFKTEIADLKETYDKNESTYADDKKKDERKKIMEKLQEYQDMGQDLTGKLKELQFQEYEKLKKEIDTVIQNLGKKEKYALVLDKSAVFFGGTDITDMVIKELNKGKAKK